LKSPQSVPVLAMALNDRSERVTAEAAHALANIGTPEALEALRCAFVEDVVERPNYLANAIALFGKDGFAVLARCAQSSSPTLRYFAARGLGSTGLPEAAPILEQLQSDLEKTPFGGAVATAARAGLKTLRRMLARDGEQGVPRAGP
jgi:HEAT repeat protein